MRSLAEALQSIAVTLWIGGLWVVGFIVAPLLFSRLDDRALAGLLAGKFFSIVAWTGMACAIYVLVYRVGRYRADCLRQGFFWTALALLLLVLAGELGVQPVLAALKAEALPKAVMESVLRERFATWHGVASVLYVIQSLLGAALVILFGKGR